MNFMVSFLVVFPCFSFEACWSNSLELVLSIRSQPSLCGLEAWKFQGHVLPWSPGRDAWHVQISQIVVPLFGVNA
jgi:hypothetical protein